MKNSNELPKSAASEATRFSTIYDPEKEKNVEAYVPEEKYLSDILKMQLVVGVFHKKQLTQGSAQNVFTRN